MTVMPAMTVVKHDAPACRRVERGRLVYYRRKADPQFWDDQWKTMICPQFYEQAAKGDLGRFERVFTSYLPRNRPVIEAGCGPGQFVLALRQRGYNAEGVDWAESTVNNVCKLFPTLPIRRGDVCDLNVADGYYGGYISLGVIEHRAAGPEPFLQEAFRVLEPGGVGIFSVPWFNSLRVAKHWVGCFRAPKESGAEFYQYAYRSSEVHRYLVGAGFKVLESCSSRNLQMGFEDELPLIQRIYCNGRPGRVMKRLVRRIAFLPDLFSHSRIYVCIKPT